MLLEHKKEKKKIFITRHKIEECKNCKPIQRLLFNELGIVNKKKANIILYNRMRGKNKKSWLVAHTQSNNKTISNKIPNVMIMG